MTRSTTSAAKIPDPRAPLRCGMVAYHNLLNEGSYRVRVLGALRAIIEHGARDGVPVRFYLIGFEGIRPFLSRALRNQLRNDLGDWPVRVVLVPTLPERLRIVQTVNLWIAGLFLGASALILRLRVVHAHSSLSAFAASLGKYVGRYKLIFDDHGADTEERVARGLFAQGTWLQRLYSRRERFAARRADAHICVCNALGRLRGAQRAESWIVPCCVDDPPSEEAVIQRRKNARAALNLEADLVVGYLGSAAVWQQPVETISACAALASSVPNSVLLILTGEPDVFRDLLVRCGIAASRYKILSLPHSKVPEYLPAMDLGLLLREDTVINRVASPTKFAEYLAAGVPVLTTEALEDFAGITRREGVGLVWHEPRPDETEKRLLVEFVRTLGPRREELARKCVKAVRKELTWTVGGERYWECYRTFLTKALETRISRFNESRRRLPAGECKRRGQLRITYLCLEPQQSRFHISGYAVHLNAMIGAFQRAGHEVNVIVLGEWLGRKQVAGSVAARQGPSLKALVKRAVPNLLWETAKDLRVMSYDRRFRAQYKEAILDFRPDVIYQQTAFLGAAGRKIAEEAGIPRMAELHAPIVEERYRDGRGSLLSGYAARVETRNLMSAQRVRTVSSPLKANLVARGIPAERIIVQPNGVDLDRFRPESGDGARIRAQWRLQGKTVFGFAGSFFRWHSLDSLLRGFALARSNCPDAGLLIVGDGEDGRELRQLAGTLGIADSTAFTGTVSFSEVKDYYAAMDVCCMAGSNWYGSPLKLLEYGAMRKPIIAPDTAAVRDFMQDTKDCLMVKPGSVEEVADAIRRLYAQPSLREEVAARFHEKVVRTCSWDAVAGNILSHLEAVARGE